MGFGTTVQLQRAAHVHFVQISSFLLIAQIEESKKLVLYGFLISH